MKKVMGTEVKVTRAMINKVVAGEGSKSGKMKELFDLGLEVKEIAKVMDVRYNFVYNVVSNYAAMNGLETATTKKAGKKEAIIELYKQGKTNKEISIELKTNYNYVFNVLKQVKQDAKGEAK
jgi:transposase